MSFYDPYGSIRPTKNEPMDENERLRREAEKKEKEKVKRKLQLGAFFSLVLGNLVLLFALYIQTGIFWMLIAGAISLVVWGLLAIIASNDM